MLTSDVVVVGAGMAGASVAAELSDRLSVVVVEAAASGEEHSTGRSAAALLPSYGSPVVRALTRASRPLHESRAAEFGVPLVQPRPLLWLATDDQSEHTLAAMARTLPDMETLTAAQAHRIYPPLRPERVRSAALDSSAADVDVAALHQTYFKTLRQRGGTIRFNAPVREIRRDARGWQVTAGDHVISCAKIVNAAGAWVDEVAERAGVPPIGIQPRRRSAFVSPTPYAGDLSGLPLAMDACERWYVKPEAGLMLGSPADATDVPPGRPRPDELEIARALEAIEETTTLGLRSVQRAWAGLRNFVADNDPVVGARTGHEDFHFLGGQGGYGIQMAPALARLTADIVAEGALSQESAQYGVAVASLRPDRLSPSDALPHPATPGSLGHVS
ncbi:N-methyltryptophan oxidase [Streptomyces sp. YIM 130001]|uniref:NAD(P)/FAD-dependent oxidoreductase n=1 Tax=Streptomyces sp. YIM 130001 TaxID=2259644 RepID=UPI000E65D138|nr:FAD-dependent oxidoreductase [Streptomyces sp. YIM 130001]RII09638.1 N-methyltryptophan oxidase [Streptomyces sp. YIM 130001]